MTPVSFSPSLLDGKNLGDFSADTCRVVFSSWYILLKGVSLENNKSSSESEKEEWPSNGTRFRFFLVVGGFVLKFIEAFLPKHQTFASF
jgi:hypothetical protein